LLTLAVLLLAVTGCKKDFLERKPLGELTYDTYFQTSEQAVQAVNAVYNELRQWNCAALPWLGITDIISDDADKGSTPTDALYMLDIDNFNFDGTNSVFISTWTGFYNTIARANLAIQRIPDVQMDAALKARLLAECKFLRAYSYYVLVQWYGDLPIITQTLTSDQYYSQKRQPVAAVYDQIEHDLRDAMAGLPQRSKYASGDLGRATRGAAQGILAKLFMLKKDYTNAEKYCKAIIDSNEYSLVAKYSDIFLPSGENGSESIFEVQAASIKPDAGGVTGAGATPYNMVQGVRGIPNLGWGFNRPSDNLVAEYETRDPRFHQTVIQENDILPDGVTQVQPNPEILHERFNRKAWVPNHPGLQDNGPGNIRILRFADILLLEAEALNELGRGAEALPYLNQVRLRAKKSGATFPNDLPPVAVTDQSQLREKIYHERRVELAMEHHRWFDLLRWGRAGSVMKAVGKNFVDGKHELLPVPQSEVDLTGGILVQNKNY
jgi:tetratricopeptide (TPR) repeat protein